MEWTEPKILANAQKVLNIITTQMATDGRAYKVPKRQSRMLINEMGYLQTSIRGGLVRNKHTNQPELFSFSGMQEKNIAILFSSLGFLIGVYEGLPGLKDVSKILKEFFADLLKKL